MTKVAPKPTGFPSQERTPDFQHTQQQQQQQRAEARGAPGRHSQSNTPEVAAALAAFDRVHRRDREILRALAKV